MVFSSPYQCCSSCRHPEPDGRDQQWGWGISGVYLACDGTVWHGSAVCGCQFYQDDREKEYERNLYLKLVHCCSAHFYAHHCLCCLLANLAERAGGNHCTGVLYAPGGWD